MRTTMDLDDALLAAARRRAAERGSTLTAFVEEALAAALAPRAPSGERFKLNWKTHRGRLRAGIDISDRDALFEAMEGRR